MLRVKEKFDHKEQIALPVINCLKLNYYTIFLTVYMTIRKGVKVNEPTASIKLVNMTLTFDKN